MEKTCDWREGHGPDQGEPRLVEPLRVGPSASTEAGIVEFGEYLWGGTSMAVCAEDGEPLYTATVFISNHILPEDEVWIENDGIAKVFIDAGIINVTGRRSAAGALHAILTDQAINARDD